MNRFRLALGLALLLCGARHAHPALAQGADAAAARAQSRFRELDLNADGVLSGREVESCRCRAYDTDGDGEIMKREFYLGYMLAAFEGQQQGQGARAAPAPAQPPGRRESAAQPPAALAQGPFQVGDRVDWYIGDIWYRGTVYNAQNGEYQIERDGYGRAREWATPRELRRVAEPAATQPAPQPAQPVRPPQTPRTPAGVAEGQYGIGDRVALNIGDDWYPGVIYNAQGDQYQVNRDDYGRAREWVTPRELRREQRPAALGPVAGQAGAGPFRLGERVEVTLGGGSYRGNIGAADNGSDRYQVDRYSDPAGGAARGDGWMGGAQIRRLAVVPEARVAGGPLPGSVPPGLYVCTTSGTYPSTAGRLRILGGGTYSGLTPDGSGPQRRFAYDAATGSIEWAGGIPNLAATVQRSQYSVSATGRAGITVWYQRGGNTNSVSCQREGA